MNRRGFIGRMLGALGLAAGAPVIAELAPRAKALVRPSYLTDKSAWYLMDYPRKSLSEQALEE